MAFVPDPFSATVRIGVRWRSLCYTAQNLPAEWKIMVERREKRIEPISREDQSRNNDEVDQARSERRAPSFSVRERQIMRFYNPVTGKCDLTEEEATKAEERDQAVSEELERRRQERLAAWQGGVGLDKEAKQALDNFSPQSAWFHISNKVGDALQLDPEKSQQLAEEMGLFQPEGESPYQNLDDLLEVIARTWLPSVSGRTTEERRELRETPDTRVL